jgi:Fe2+ transport system protein FeoA
MVKRPDYIHCPMCGIEFEKAGSVCERSCPVSSACKTVRCPACDYEFPEGARSVSWLQRLFRRRAAKPRPPQNPNAVGLDSLASGEKAELLELSCMSGSRRNTLTVFGLTPGTVVTLLQRSPSFVIRVGETELGLDREIAQGIYVKRL